MSPQTKDELRRELLARRRERSDDARWRDAAALAAGLPAVLDDLGADPDRPICLHVPVRREPGAAPDGAVPMLDAAVALGRRVLLPVTVGEAPLDWASFGGRADLVPGPHGLLEPGGARVGPGAIGEAAVVVVPALAATAAGVRLGRGGGHYDRSLPLASPVDGAGGARRRRRARRGPACRGARRAGPRCVASYDGSAAHRSGGSSRNTVMLARVGTHPG